MAKMLNKPETRPTHDQIAQRAYEIYERSGRVPGRDVQNWLDAEKQLMAVAELKKEVAATLQVPPKLAARQTSITRA